MSHKIVVPRHDYFVHYLEITLLIFIKLLLVMMIKLIMYS